MTTVPGVLGACGYYTAAVSRNAYAGVATGLERDFDEFVAPTFAGDLLSYPHILSLVKYGLTAHRHGGFTVDKQQHPKSYFITDVAKRVLANSPDDCPTFLYCHYNDPHRPYDPPPSYVDRYTDEINAEPADALQFAREMHDNAYEYMAAGIPFSDEQWEMLFAMYDAMIAYTDACLEPLIKYVREEIDETILVVTADHGELFGERGLLGHHIVLDDAVTHVPLVVSGLPELTRVRDDPVQHIDVMQTLVALAEGDTSQFQGCDLRTDSREYAFSQDLRGTVAREDKRDYDRIRQYNDAFDISGFHQSLLTAARTTTFKLVHTEEWTRLHELPDETTDVSAAHPEIARRYKAVVERWLETTGARFKDSPRETTHTDAVKQQLHDMGYLE